MLDPIVCMIWVAGSGGSALYTNMQMLQQSSDGVILIQWNPSITATIGTRIFGRFRGVAANQGVQRSHAYLISL